MASQTLLEPVMPILYKERLEQRQCIQSCNFSTVVIIQDRCEYELCWDECRVYYDVEQNNCNVCIDKCVKLIKHECAIDNDNYECLYMTTKPSMIASCSLFFINFLVGIVVLVLFAKLPRDPCCYPSYIPHVQRSQLQFRVNSGKVENLL